MGRTERAGGAAMSGDVTLTVVRSGPLSTVQDQGRPGLAHLGVPRSGALDAPALRRANLLVGNDGSAAGLEFTLSGATLRADTTLTVAVTGASVPVTVDGARVGFDVAVTVPAGATLAVGTAKTGLRSYLAVAGGIAAPPVLGSRATDTLSGLGPSPLRAGDTLPVGQPGGAGPGGAGPGGDEPAPGGRRHSDTVDGATGRTVRVYPGPRVDWFTPDAVAAFLAGPYTVSPTSNRVGARLTGPQLTRAVTAELPSEGLVLGAVQVPADGQPLVFLADHPTTGGYPVIAVLHPADVALLAQARPGTTVRFTPADDTWKDVPGGSQR